MAITGPAGTPTEPILPEASSSTTAIQSLIHELSEATPGEGKAAIVKKALDTGTVTLKELLALKDLEQNDDVLTGVYHHILEQHRDTPGPRHIELPFGPQNMETLARAIKSYLVK